MSRIHPARRSIATAALLLALSACSDGSSSLSAPTSGPSAGATCDVLDIQAVLPEGWSPELRSGPGGGGAGPSLGHWSGGDGRFVELTEGGPMYALSEPLRQLTVLDRPALGSAVHDGFGVQFDACGQQHGLTGFGLPGPELYALAESLHFDKQPGTGQGLFDPACADRTVRPHYVVLACADAGSTADKLTWSSWGDDEAIAHGLLVDNDCDPTCVGGRKRDYEATFRFYARRAGRFTTVDITFPTSGPGGQRRRTSYL